VGGEQKLPRPVPPPSRLTTPMPHVVLVISDFSEVVLLSILIHCCTWSHKLQDFSRNFSASLHLPYGTYWLVLSLTFATGLQLSASSLMYVCM